MKISKRQGTSGMTVRRLVYYTLKTGEQFLAFKDFPLDIDLQEWINKRSEKLRFLGVTAVEYDDVEI